MPEPTSLAEELRTAAFAHIADAPPPDEPFTPDPGRMIMVDQEANRADGWPRKVGRRFADARIDQLDGAFADLATRWDGSCNVLLLGDVGAGKTHAAAAMAYVQHVEHGQTLIFRSAPMLLDAMRPGRDDADQALQQAVDVDLLVIDDLGSERATEWTAERLHLIVDERDRECRPIIATSNLAPDRLHAHVGDRVWSRLYGDAIREQIAGDDRRRRTA